MKKVLFVCTANICRSPMAAALFEALAEQRGLPFRAESAGVAALVGEPAPSHARRVAEEFGMDLAGHRGRQVDEDMIRSADLVLAMTPEHRETLRRNFGDSRAEIQTLPEYTTGDAGASIADPFGRSLGAYRSSARDILWHLELLVKRLKAEGGPGGSAPTP